MSVIFEFSVLFVMFLYHWTQRLQNHNLEYIFIVNISCFRVYSGIILIITARLCFSSGADIFVSNNKTKAFIYFTPCTNSFSLLVPIWGTFAKYEHPCLIWAFGAHITVSVFDQQLAVWLNPNSAFSTKQSLNNWTCPAGLYLFWWAQENFTTTVNSAHIRFSILDQQFKTWKFDFTRSAISRKRTLDPESLNEPRF